MCVTNLLLLSTSCFSNSKHSFGHTQVAQNMYNIKFFFGQFFFLQFLCMWCGTCFWINLYRAQIYLDSVSLRLTDFMGQSPWEANSFSGSPEVPCILWNLNVHCHLHKSLPLVPILSQINPVHALRSCFYKIHFHVILPSMLASSMYMFPSGFPTTKKKTPVFISLLAYTCHIPHSSHQFDILNSVWWGVQIMRLLIIQFSAVPCYSLPLRPHFFFSTLFFDNLSVCFTHI
jgi:thiol-disulfide isomerase/thioredoxin